MSDDQYLCKLVNKKCSIECVCGHKIDYASARPNWTQKYVVCPNCKAAGWVSASMFGPPPREIAETKRIESDL